MLLNKRLASIAFLGLALISSCKNTRNEPESFLKPKPTLVISGQAFFENGQKVNAQPIIMEYILEGSHFFDDSADARCRVLDHHMGANQTFSTSLDGQSQYQGMALMETFSALVDESCYIAPNLTEATIDTLLVSATIPADVPNCQAYCQASQANISLSQCMAECVNGGRKISAHVSFSQEQVKAARNSMGLDMVIKLTSPLIFYSLSEPILDLPGADLQVDEASARNSLSIEFKNFPSDSCALAEACIGGPGTRKLLKFDGVIKNLGSEDFVLGAPNNNPLFQHSSCHGHYHLKEAMSYELLEANTFAPVVVNGQTVIGHKQGFCMLDMRKISGNNASKFTCSNQGLTSGWADVYSKSLDCQWIDVTGVPAGQYVVRITVNPGGTLDEIDVSNNSVLIPYTLK